MTETVMVENATCLGCGCACDDIDVVVEDGRIANARNTCDLGRRWFGNGEVPSRVVANGTATSLDEAIDAAARTLRDAKRPLVYIAPDVSCETQREAVALADVLRARLDSTTAAAASFVLATQELGLASATLGEIRNRADLLVVWAADLTARYPRFTSRYAPDPVGTHVPQGRRSRNVIAVDVGRCAATLDADTRITLDAGDEIAALNAVEALARTPESATRHAGSTGTAWDVARTLAGPLLAASYTALVYDAEPDERDERSSLRFHALASLAQSLNVRTRCAAVALRAGGNRSGADTVLVAQTGYPFAVDFGRGYPRYHPTSVSVDGLMRNHDVDVTLLVGNAARIPGGLATTLRATTTILIGPRATDVTLGSTSVAVDTGVAGIHTGGTAFRTDDVPLPLRASIAGPPSAAETLRAVTRAIRRT
jgi:formylmethanofuran dehydrogenase subunit B